MGGTATPTNEDLAVAIEGVLNACVRFRRLYGRATKAQREIVMAGWPWPLKTLELQEMKDWVQVAAADLRSCHHSQPHPAFRRHAG